MPRSYDDYGEDRAWDDWYNSCHCEPYEDDSGELVWPDDCDYCLREREARAEIAAAAAARFAEEERLRASGWYTEITTVQRFINRLNWLPAPEFFQERLDVFKELFETLTGYERFLATQPRFRAVVAEKLAEAKSLPAFVERMSDVLDRLEAVMAGLVARDDFVS